MQDSDSIYYKYIAFTGNILLQSWGNRATFISHNLPATHTNYVFTTGNQLFFAFFIA